jgi:hypothetical protein
LNYSKNAWLNALDFGHSFGVLHIELARMNKKMMRKAKAAVVVN